MKHRLALWTALAVFISAAPACRSWFYPEQWHDMGAEYDVELPILWDAVKLTLIDQFETVEYERSAEGIMVTGWDEHLSYLAGQGYREQAHIRVDRGEKGYQVHVRVKRETNEEPIYTLESKHARWRAADDSPSRAQHLVGLIHIKLQSVIDS